MAQADMEQIQQVLYNLLSNAIKFSLDNSTITLETTEKTARSLFLSKIMALEFQRQVSRRSGNDFIRLIDPEARIKKGTGLGLAIVKEILHAHGQHINVISTEGVGTEFIFTLEKAKVENSSTLPLSFIFFLIPHVWL